MERRIYFADFLKENDIPLTKMGYPLTPDDDGGTALQAKAEGNNTKVAYLFDENDWKFLLQIPPKYWTRALHWRFGEGLLHESEERELNGLNDNTLTEHANQIKFAIGRGAYVTILSPQSPECIEAYNKQRKLKSLVPENTVTATDDGPLYVGFKTLFNKIEDPVKVSAQPTEKENKEEGIPSDCDDPNELKARVEARNRKMPEGPGIDQINLYNSKHPNHAHLRPKEEYPKGVGLIGGDLTEPDRIPNSILAKKSKSARDVRHPFGGWLTIKLTKASEYLSVWLKGSSYFNNGQEIEKPILPSRIVNEDGQQVVKDPLTGQRLPVTMLSPAKISSLWADSIGADDDISYGHEGNQIAAKKHSLLIPAFKKRVCYKETNAKGISETKCHDVWMPVLADGHAVPNLTSVKESKEGKDESGNYMKLKNVHLTPEQMDAFYRRKMKGGGKGKARTPESILARTQRRQEEEEEGSSEDKKKNEWLTNIGEAQNLFNMWDLLRPEQRKYVREGLKTQHHLAAFEYDPNFNQTWNIPESEFREIHQSQGDRYLIGGFPPMYNQPPKGFIPTNPKKQDEIFIKYIHVVEEEAAEGFDSYIRGLSKKLGKDKRAGADDEGMEGRMGTSSSGDIIGAMEHNRNVIIDVVAAILLTNLNSGKLGIYDPSLCLVKAGKGADNRSSRVQKARSEVETLSQLALEVGTGASLPPRRKRQILSTNTEARKAYADYNKGFPPPTRDELNAFLDAHPNFKPNRRVQITGFEDDDATGNQAISTSPSRLANPDARVNSAGKSTLARPQWLSVKFGRLSNRFNSMYDKLKELKGKAAEFARSSMENMGEGMEEAISVYNSLYLRWLRKLTDEGMTADDQKKHELAAAEAGKELPIALGAKFPNLPPEELAKLSDKTKKTTPTNYQAPSWFTDAFDSFTQDGEDDEMELPDNFRIPLSMKDISVNKGILGIVEYLTKFSKGIDDYANEYIEKEKKTVIDSNETVNRYAVRLAKIAYPKTPQENIIKQLTDMGYMPYEAKFTPQKPTQPQTTPIAPAVNPPGKVAAANTSASLVSLLTDPVGKLKEILQHPELAQHKPHLQASIRALSDKLIAKREEAEKAGKSYVLTPEENTALLKLSALWYRLDTGGTK